MTSSIETSHPKALDALSEAIQDVVAYRRNPTNIQRLNDASTKIQSALKEDPGYLRAVYYDAIVDDLKGKPMDAAPKYEQVLKSAPEGSPFFQEVRYNLGVAYYHGYSWSSLDKAISEFTRVLEETKDSALMLHASSGRAQAHAMHMIPPDPARADLGALVEYSHRCQTDIAAVLKPKHRFFSFLKRRGRKQSGEQAAKWAAHNASGMRRMYLADYWKHLNEDQRKRCGEPTVSTDREILERALADLQKAEAVRGRDWANWCDIASAYMRLGIIEADAKRADAFFQKALLHLTEVVTLLRPGYGFALYEIGRVYRLWGRFADALQSLDAALVIPKHVREVGDTRVNLERARALANSKEYP